MKKLFLSVTLVGCLWLSAQQTRREVRQAAPNPGQETRANGAEVPAAYAVNAHLERVVVLRFKYDSDLRAELEKMIRQEKIHNAVVLSAFGSVRNYQVHQVGNRELPPKDILVKDPSAPADIIGMSGAVIQGRLHAHITLANQDKAFGGHLEPDTRVFTFAMVTLGVVDDGVDLSKIDDWNYR